MTEHRQRWPIIFAVVLLAFGATAAPGLASQPQPLGTYLSGWNLAAADRAGSLADTDWSGREPPPEATLRMLVRLFDRLRAAPAAWRQAWLDGATPLTAADLDVCLQTSQPVRLRGTAVETRRLDLPETVAAIAGRRSLGLIRIAQDAGPDVLLVVPELPGTWPDAGVLAEPAGGEALIVAVPTAAGAVRQPLVAVAVRFSWWPRTPLGLRGMDYGLFADVVDGQPLRSAEAAAFYQALAAGGSRATAAADQPLPPAGLVPLLDPARNWFADRRGDLLVLEGTARRVTRVPVADDRWRAAVGQDHYWEVFLFVATPLLEIAGRRQDSYPVVCCLLDLPSGLPVGDRVSERLRVAGYAFKRYRYQTRAGAGDAVRESPLLVGGRPLWLPAAAAPQLPGWFGWPVAGLVAVAAVLLLRRFWRRRRRPAAAPLPERITIPSPGDQPPS